MKKIAKKIFSFIMSAVLSSSFFTAPVAQAEEIPGWTMNVVGNADGYMEIDNTQSASGKSSMKIVNNTPFQSNVYVNVRQDINVEAGKSYDIQLQVKAKNAGRVVFLAGWDKRYYMTPFGGTYDWTNFHFIFHATKTEKLMFSVLVDDVAESVWVDDVIIKEVGTDRNLVTNSTFEADGGASLEVEEESGEVSLTSVYNKIRSSESFSIEDLEKVRGAFKYMPMYRAENITIDGDVSDWEKYPALSMPTLPTQYQVYIKDGRLKDVEAKSRFAFDEENFYFMIEVIDDNYVYFMGDNDYWRGDSIQLAISGMDEKFGNEIGLVHDAENNTSKIVGTVINQQEVSADLKLSTSKNGNKTVYEMKFPWYVKFEEIPEQILFNFLINDNDGDGRRYCAELAPGISEGKINSLFPVLEMRDSEKDWYGWIESDRGAFIAEEEKLEYYLVNEGDEKTFTVENSFDGTVEEITVPEKSGIRREIKHTFDDEGEYEVKVKIKSSGDEFTSKTIVKAERRPPDASYAETVATKIEKNAQILKNLIDECELRGLSTDYELITYRVLERFSGYVREDAAKKDFTRIYYTESACDKMFEKSKSDLEAYLSGEKEPRKVPRYVTSEMEIDGRTAWATTELDGKREVRPVFFVGYGHFDAARADVPLFNDFGLNANQSEMGPTHSMVSAWTTYASASPDSEYGKYSGEASDGENSLKIVYNNEKTANQYVSFYQTVFVEPGKTYELKLNAKANNITAGNAVAFTANGFNDFAYLPTGTYDWTKYKVSYTAPAGVGSTVVRILVQAPVTEILLDDVTFCEEESDKNLLRDGSFENYGELNYSFNEENGRLKQIISLLENAEKNNVAVSVLVSPHYFMDDLIEEYGIGATGGFMKYNINADIAKEIVEKHLRGFVTAIKDYKALNNICLSNEPQFQVDSCGDFYLEDWQNYLAEVYGNDISKLNETYKTSYTSFADVDFVRNQKDLAKEYDYKKYNDKVFAKWHKWMADIVHEIAPDIPLNAKVMGYTAADANKTGARFQNNGTGYEGLSFLEINGCDYWNFPGIAMPLEKNMWYDYMCSIRNAPIANTEDHLTKDGATDWTEEVAKYTAQDIYQGAIHGRYMSVGWVWDRSNSLSGHILQRPDMLKFIGDASHDLNRLAYEITALQNEEVEVGILYSEADMLHNVKVNMRALYEAYAAGIYNGKPVRFITESKIHTMNDYEIITVPNTKYLTTEMLNALYNYVNNGGKVIIIDDGDALKFDVHGIEQDSAAFEHIRNNSSIVNYVETAGKYTDRSSPELGKAFRDVLKEKNLYYVSVVDAVSGEPVYEVEYNVGAYNGKALVNLVNYTPDKDVKIYINDKLVTSSKERRSENVFGEVVHLVQYEPITLEIEVDNVLFDTFGHWAEEEIVSLKDKGVIYGVSESRYKPDKTTTRAEFLSLAMRASGLGEAEYTNNISDVSADDWFAKTVSSAVNNGIIASDIPFRPNDRITREEMCEILVKCYEKIKGEVVYGENAEFTDSNSIKNKDAVNKAVSLGLMFGRDDGSFGASDFATRAESAAVINRMLK